MPLGAIGQVPNYSVFQGIIKNALVEGVTTSTWNPRSGGTSRSVFKGSQAQITALAQDARTAGYEYSISGGHVWTLEVTFPWDIIVDTTEQGSNPLWTWELINTPVDIDLYDSTDRHFIGKLSLATKENIDRKIKMNDVATPPWDGSVVDTDTMGCAVAAYGLKKIGVRGKQMTVQTLRRTIVVPNTYTTDLNLYPANNMKVMTRAQLLSVYNNSSNPLNRIPDIIVNALPESLPLISYPSTTATNVSGYSMDQNGVNVFVGYLQFPPEYNMVSVTKVQVTQHWQFNKWSAGSWGLYDDIQGGTGTNPTVTIT